MLDQLEYVLWEKKILGLEYISLLRMAGRFKSVEGFIWYVTLGKVVKI